MKKTIPSVSNDASRREACAARSEAREKRFTVEPRACRLRPGFDETRFNQILDALDTQAAASRIARTG